MLEKVNYTVNIHHEDGVFWADVVEIPGVFATGDTQEDLMEALSEAVGMALSTTESRVQAQLHTVEDVPPIRTVAAEAVVSQCPA